MANDLNQCQFIGRLGNDPETRYTQDQKPVTTFSIACGWKSKDKEGVEWVPCTAFGKLADICGEYLRKGSQVFVSGKFKTDKYDKNGETRFSTKVIINQMQMLGPKSDAAPQQDAARQPPGNQSQQLPDGWDDDIPF